METILEGLRLNDRRIEIEWFTGKIPIQMNSLPFSWIFFFVHIVQHIIIIIEIPLNLFKLKAFFHSIFLFLQVRR